MEKRKRLAALLKEAQEINGKIIAEKRGYTDEERTQYDTKWNEYCALKNEIEAEERVREQQADLEREAQYLREPIQPAAQPDTRENQPGSTVRIVSEQAFRGVGHFLQEVRQAQIGHSDSRQRLEQYNQEIRTIQGMNEGTPSEGGFLVLTQMNTEIMQRTFSDPGIPARCTRQGIGAGFNALSYPMIDETKRSDGYRQGGVLVYWPNEGGAITASKTKIKEGRVPLQKVAALTYATDELLSDATALGGWYQREVPKAIAWELTDKIINGNGIGKPLGILTSSAYVSVAKASGQEAATIISDNIMSMYARHLNPMNAVWIINQECWPQIFKLHQVIGTGGVPLFLPPGGIVTAPFGTLFGRPIIPVEQCQALGTEGDIMFADFAEYLLVDKGGVNYATSIHVEFDTVQTAFRWVYRVNGQPVDNSVVTPANGSATLGSFVTLATRA